MVGLLMGDPTLAHAHVDHVFRLRAGHQVVVGVQLGGDGPLRIMGVHNLHGIISMGWHAFVLLCMFFSVEENGMERTSGTERKVIGLHHPHLRTARQGGRTERRLATTCDLHLHTCL